MIALYIIIILLIIGFAGFYIFREYYHKPNQQKNGGTKGVLKNKKFIENMVANVESIIVYANGNDALCRRLVEVKDSIRFFNPTTNEKVLLTDAKLASRLDDLKLATAKDNTQETCLRLLEEIEAYIIQRKKDEIN